MFPIPGIILGMGSPNGRRRYYVTIQYAKS